MQTSVRFTYGRFCVCRHMPSADRHNTRCGVCYVNTSDQTVRLQASTRLIRHPR
jgi:hypothetical protein